MAKKNIFEKMGLVEAVGPEPDVMDYEFEETMEPEVTVDVSNFKEDGDIVADVYASTNMQDTSKSIFKVEDIIKTLPETMATDTLKKTVLSLMVSFGITTDQVLEDSIARIEALKSANKAITDENSVKIADASAEIESAKVRIQELESDIAKYQKQNSNSVTAVSAEIERITKLAKFVGGEN